MSIQFIVLHLKHLNYANCEHACILKQFDKNSHESKNIELKLRRF